MTARPQLLKTTDVLNDSSIIVPVSHRAGITGKADGTQMNENTHAYTSMYSPLGICGTSGISCAISAAALR